MQKVEIENFIKQHLKPRPANTDCDFCSFPSGEIFFHNSNVFICSACVPAFYREFLIKQNGLRLFFNRIMNGSPQNYNVANPIQPRKKSVA